MLKIENRNWKFGLHAFVLLRNAFNFEQSQLLLCILPRLTQIKLFFR